MMARINPNTVRITTTHPAKIVNAFGTSGIESVPSFIPEPTARETSIPTIQIKNSQNTLTAFLASFAVLPAIPIPWNMPI